MRLVKPLLLIKSLLILLVLVMASEPVLASSCAAKCATQAHDQNPVQNHTTAQLVSDMTGMAHCHESVSQQYNDQHNQFDHSKHTPQQHNACAMGALCGFGQMATFVAVSKFVLLESSVLVFPKFTPAEKSVDLSPPLKPPA